MIIERRSPRTNKLNTMDLDVTQAQLDAYARKEGLIQNIFPHLTDEEREFIQTGYTPEDWAAIFPPEEEDL